MFGIVLKAVKKRAIIRHIFNFSNKNYSKNKSPVTDGEREELNITVA